MSSNNPHIDPTDGIEDVELEDDEVDEKSFEELVKERRASTQEAVKQYRETTEAESESDTTEKSESAESESSELKAEVSDPTVEDDGDLIKMTGIAHMSVDTTDPDTEALNDLIKDAERGEVEAGMERGISEDPVFDSIESGTRSMTDEFEKDKPVPEMEPVRQAEALSKEATQDLNIDGIVKDAADLPKSPSGVHDTVYEKVYEEITKFVRTMYGASAIDNGVLKAVREKIATDAANRARVLRRASEDGVTTDAEGYDPEEGGEDATEGDEESADGGETDAPATENDSEDMDVDGEDVDLEG